MVDELCILGKAVVPGLITAQQLNENRRVFFNYKKKNADIIGIYLM